MKNAAFRTRNPGRQPKVSEEQFQQSLSGGSSGSSAVSATAQPPATVAAQMPVGKIVTFNNGQKWMKNADGTLRPVTN